MYKSFEEYISIDDLNFTSDFDYNKAYKIQRMDKDRLNKPFKSF